MFSEYMRRIFPPLSESRYTESMVLGPRQLGECGSRSTDVGQLLDPIQLPECVVHVLGHSLGREVPRDSSCLAGS